jgi:hypothetical protein
MAVFGVRGPAGVSPLDPAKQRTSTRPASSRDGSRVEDRVTLSSAARSSPQIPEKLRSLSMQAHADPKLAEQLAYDYAHTEQSPILDISGLENASGPARYASTGEPVTAESEQRYKQQAESLRSSMSTLYADEKAKGTPAADLLDKLLATLGSQPGDDFKTVIGLGN